jgi:hypothetical protein
VIEDDDDANLVKKELWVRGIRDQHLNTHFTESKYLQFSADDIICVTEKESEKLWKGYVVGDKNKTPGVFSPEHVVASDIKAVCSLSLSACSVF